jgi:hypothetical protein
MSIVLALPRAAQPLCLAPRGQASVRAKCQCRLARNLGLPGCPPRFSESLHGDSPGCDVLTRPHCLRNRPDVAGQWSADEIALRWCRVFPPRDDATGEPVEPGEQYLAMLASNSERLAELRERLANLSWFMIK